MISYFLEAVNLVVTRDFCKKVTGILRQLRCLMSSLVKSYFFHGKFLN